MLLIVQPMTIIFATIDPLIDSLAFHLVADKVALESAPIWPDKLALPMLLSMAIFTLKDGSISPDLFSFAMVFVLKPVSEVKGTVDVRIASLTIALVIFPVAHVGVSI